MKVSRLPDVVPAERPRSVAIGTFDGVHLGHREVIGDSDTVLTFDPHPMSVIRPEAAPEAAHLVRGQARPDRGPGSGGAGGDPLRRRLRLPQRRGVRGGRADRAGSARARVSVGENFRFGHGAEGDAALLRAQSEFETRVVPLVEVAGETVSSSHIRGLVAAGEVAQAAEFLGGPFLFEGEVVSGDRRGRELGMPTANLVPDDRLVCPGHGVYAAWAHGHPAAVNVGVRPTFETGRGLLVEAHLIDFEGDLYGQTLRIAFLERMRGERRFESVDALVEQMHRDVAQAREICARSSHRAA